ncbi:hypothetical protein LWI29_034618 [Acer saccharum]|uniref:Uncharacterized protein n=1 Tax=Acer saccharum TaxID=4024 RepID=A0AA39W607_ACESA|nr:hypothetical protein LWI29_034618 [Acer saccharum]
MQFPNLFVEAHKGLKKKEIGDLGVYRRRKEEEFKDFGFGLLEEEVRILKNLDLQLQYEGKPWKYAANMSGPGAAISGLRMLRLMDCGPQDENEATKAAVVLKVLVLYTITAPASTDLDDLS